MDSQEVEAVLPISSVNTSKKEGQMPSPSATSLEAPQLETTALIQSTSIRPSSYIIRNDSSQPNMVETISMDPFGCKTASCKSPSAPPKEVSNEPFSAKLASANTSNTPTSHETLSLLLESQLLNTKSPFPTSRDDHIGQTITPQTSQRQPNEAPVHIQTVNTSQITNRTVEVTETYMPSRAPAFEGQSPSKQSSNEPSIVKVSSTNPTKVPTLAPSNQSQTESQGPSSYETIYGLPESAVVDPSSTQPTVPYRQVKGTAMPTNNAWTPGVNLPGRQPADSTMWTSPPSDIEANHSLHPSSVVKPSNHPPVSHVLGSHDSVVPSIRNSTSQQQSWSRPPNTVPTQEENVSELPTTTTSTTLSPSIIEAEHSHQPATAFTQSKHPSVAFARPSDIPSVSPSKDGLKQQPSWSNGPRPNSSDSILKSSRPNLLVPTFTPFDETLIPIPTSLETKAPTYIAGQKNFFPWLFVWVASVIIVGSFLLQFKVCKATSLRNRSSAPGEITRITEGAEIGVDTVIVQPTSDVESLCTKASSRRNGGMPAEGEVCIEYWTARFEPFVVGSNTRSTNERKVVLTLDALGGMTFQGQN